MVPSVDLMLAYQTDWLYFCTWSDGFINDETANPLAFLKEVSSLLYFSSIVYFITEKGRHELTKITYT